MKKLDDSTIEIIDCNIWSYLLYSLQNNEENNRHGFWTDGEEILCKTEEKASAIADFLEDMGFDYVQNGYYDPEEDKKNNKVDDHTGFWYVSID